MTPHDEARALAERIRLFLNWSGTHETSPEPTRYPARVVKKNPPLDERCTLVQMLDAALLAAHARGLEEAATYLDEGEILTDGEELDARCTCECFGILGRISTYFRQRAQAVKEGKG